MKSSLFILLTLAGLLITAGCASENGQGGSYDTTEYSQGQATSTGGTGHYNDYNNHAYWKQ